VKIHPKVLKYVLPIPILAVLAIHTLPSYSSDTAIKVMVQGSSARDMRQLVEQHGGIVTHDLHIINAVGALISRQDLNKVLQSPLVVRHLDDLSRNDQLNPEPDPLDGECNVGGSLDLGWHADQLSWKLYNKREGPANLLRLELNWPQALGQLEELQLGPNKLLQNSLAPSAEGLVLTYKNTEAPSLTGSQTLRARFSNSAGPLPGDGILQKEFSIRASFEGDCHAELIPGYANNHENTYYPAVIGADALHTHGITGAGVTVAIIDSGLWEHSTLAQNTRGDNRVLARYDAITDTTGKEVFDESGHGTHMASILAQSGPVTHAGVPTGSYKGVAPDVSLVAIKAFNVAGQGDFLDIVRAVQFAVDHQVTYGIKVLNLSFASQPRWRYWLDPINQAVMRAWASGITVVAAAGNEGPEPMTIGSPGNLPYVITVGAVTDSWTINTREDDYIPDFSSRGPTPDAHIKPDLVAPGGHMTGLTRPGSTLTRLNPEYTLKTGEYVMTGSSQASALVSGIVALLLQLEPELSPDDIKCKLTSSAELAINSDGKLSYSPFQQGYGYVSATRAITLGQRGCGNAGLDIQRDMQGTEHFEGPAIILDNGETSLPGLDEMLSEDVSEQGLSKSRRWGVKAHIERPDYQWSNGQTPDQHNGLDWETQYLQEKSQIEELASPPQKSNTTP
jgi:serine protease AprX